MNTLVKLITSRPDGRQLLLFPAQRHSHSSRHGVEARSVRSVPKDSKPEEAYLVGQETEAHLLQYKQHLGLDTLRKCLESRYTHVRKPV